MEADYSARVKKEPLTGEHRTRNRLLAIITVLLVVWGLKLSASVTLPLAVALFLVAVFWPLQQRLEKSLPRGVAAALTLLCFLLVVAGMVAATWYAVDVVSEKWPQYEGQFRELVSTLESRVRPLGIGNGEGLSGGTERSLFRTTAQVAGIVGAFFLTMAYLIFGLVEVHDYHDKLDRSLGGGQGSRWIKVAREISVDFQRFVLIRGAIALVTGFLAFLFSSLVGLDFAFIWGLITFILEFIPTVGTFVSMVPPVLFALFQFGPSWQALVVFFGLGTIQFLMGNVIEPLVEGKYLRLSPLVILVSIAFWAWVWGVAGAFIALPLTMFVAIACRHFENTRWIAVLLSYGDGGRVRRKRKKTAG